MEYREGVLFVIIAPPLLTRPLRILHHRCTLDIELDDYDNFRLLFQTIIYTVFVQALTKSEVRLLQPTILFNPSGKVILTKEYLLKWLGCSLGRKI